MEILVVLAILGLLAGLAIHHLGNVWERAKIQGAELFVKTTAKTALVSFSLSMRRLPTTAEGLQVLVSPPIGNSGEWHGPYFEPADVPPDPWGEPYQYASPGKHNPASYDVWSKGPDRQSDTADDIGNWKSVAERSDQP